MMLHTPRFGRGWRPDTEVRQGVLTPKRFAASGPLPKEWIGLMDFVGGRRVDALPQLDQTSTSRCVAFSLAELVWTDRRAKGAPGVVLDIQKAYVMAQRWEQKRLGRRIPIVDEGLQPTDIVEMSAHYGALTLSNITPGGIARATDAAHVLDDVPLEAYEQAAEHKIEGWHRTVDDAATDVILDEAKRFAYAGICGMAGFDLDPPFEDYASGVWRRDAHRASAGRHMLSGPYGWSDSMRAVAMLNHWQIAAGISWGDHGFVWVAYETFASSYVSDRLFVTTVPLLEAA
jgi:hypothetical protein